MITTKRSVLAVLALLILVACAQVDKVIVAMDGIIAVATVDAIVQSNNPLVVALDNTIIDDAGQTIDLWTSHPHTAVLIGQISVLWTNLLKTVNPAIAPIVEAIVKAIQNFITQLGAVTPAPAVMRMAAGTPPRLTAKDRAKVVDMRARLAAAKVRLAANPLSKR